jgi:hypothetical protein
MAAPHVAGAFAVLLSERTYEKVEDVYTVVTEMSTKNVFKGLPANTVNNLLYVQ